MRVMAVANQKGGVGKTASTVNLARALAELGRRVLMIDYDPQGHLTEAIGAPKAPVDGANLASALLGQWSGELADLVHKVSDNLYVISTSDQMFLLEPQMYSKQGREYLLSKFLDNLVGVFDDVLLDCPPSLGALNDSALVATRERRVRDEEGEQEVTEQEVTGYIIVPVEAEDSSIGALALFIRQLRTLQDALGIELYIAGLIVNLYDPRRGRIATSTYTAFTEHPLGVLETFYDRAAVREAWRLHIPVLDHAPESDIAQSFLSLARRMVAGVSTRSATDDAVMAAAAEKGTST